MAKGAATERTLGSLHDKVASVFIKVLQRYEARLDVLDTLDTSEIEDEMLRELMEDGALPNPAMLSAITKFLKDNEISFETEQLDELTATERRLAERRADRGKLVSLSQLKAVGDE